MNYPLLSEYITAIKSAEDNFNKLSNLRPVLDEDGAPIMSSGNFAVVFKMKNVQTGQMLAVKCFLREQEGRAEAYQLIAEELEYVNSKFLTPIKYLDKELFVDTKTSDEIEFPVLLMDWVDGETLDKYIVHNKFDGFILSRLYNNFYELSKWLLSQPFAHGDLKPDNILVREDGSLVLVDYDGMYVPTMKDLKPREQGTPNYRKPYTSDLDSVFCKRIDDFAIIHILLSLKVYSLSPLFITKDKDFALFKFGEFNNISETSTYQDILSTCTDRKTNLIMMLFHKIISYGNISKEDWDLLDFDETERIYVNMEEMMCSFENVILAVNLAYSSMLYKDPARNEYSLNEYKELRNRISLAIEIQEKLRNHEWPYNIDDNCVRYSCLKPNGIEQREGIALDLSAYAIRYLFGLVKYNAINKRIPKNVFGGGNDVFSLNYDENKYESYLNDFVNIQESCAKRYNYLYIFDIRNFFQNVNLSIMKDLYFGNDFINVKWYEELFSEILDKCSVQGLNPCSEVDFFLANLYLISLDKKMMQYDGIEYYRYDDDIRIYSNNETLLGCLEKEINSVLSSLSLNLNTDKTKVIDTKKDKIELAKACFIWSSRLCYRINGDVYLLKGQSLAEIIENDLTTTYVFQLLKDINEGRFDDDTVLISHLDNLFYILKNVHKNATLYRSIIELILERGIVQAQNMLIFSEVLERIVEVLKDDTIESFVKYWIIRTYYCSDKQFYKKYLEREKEYFGQYYWPKPCYNDQIVEMLSTDFGEKGCDSLLSHISDYVISCIKPEELNKPKIRKNNTWFIDRDDLPF